MKRFSTILGLMIIAVAIQAVGPKAGKHTLIWTSSPSPGVTGYWLYWRNQTGAFNDTNRVGVPFAPQTFDLQTLPLTPGVYSLAISATNDFMAESQLSMECLWDSTVPGNPSNLKITNP